MYIGLEAPESARDASPGWVACLHDLNDPELQIFDTKSILSYRIQNTKHKYKIQIQNKEFNVSLFHQRHLLAEWQNTKYWIQIQILNTNTNTIICYSTSGISKLSGKLTDLFSSRGSKARCHIYLFVCFLFVHTLDVGVWLVKTGLWNRGLLENP